LQSDYSFSDENKLVFDKLLRIIGQENPQIYNEIQNAQLLSHDALERYFEKKINPFHEKGGAPHESYDSALDKEMLWLILGAFQKRIDALEAIVNNEMLSTTGKISGFELDEQKLDDYFEVIKSEYLAKSSVQMNNRPRLAMFTPLCPLVSGIADYTEDILIELHKYFDFDIFIDDGYQPDNPNIVSRFDILSHDEFEQKKDKYDAIMYQVGNNPHHLYMVPYILKYPGIIVLHEFVLDYLYRCLPEQYKKIAKQACVTDTYPDTDLTGNPMNKYLLDNATCIIVHSRYSKIKILEQNFAKTIRRVAHYVNPMSTTFNGALLKQKYGVQDFFVFSSVGFVTYSKRIGPTLIAFARLIAEFPNIQFKYIIVGRVDADRDEEIQAITKKYNLCEHVVITGYTESQEFLEYIQLSDVCINLRYPYGGETSGSVSRIIGMGKPCIVNDVGSFGEIPDDCCLKLPINIENEIDNIYNGMRTLFLDKDYRDQLSENAARHVEAKMNISKIGRTYSSVLKDSIQEKCCDALGLLHKMAFFLCNNFFHGSLSATKHATALISQLIFDDENN